MAHRNEHDQPIGRPLPDWTAAAPLPRAPLEGRYALVEPIDPARHGADLFAAISEDAGGSSWTYMGYGPFATRADYDLWMSGTCAGNDPFFYAIVDRSTGRASGVASHLRIDPRGGVIEVGHIHYAPRLQRTPVATEAMFLLMRRVFDELGYRRYEWKCDALNEPSRRAAKRLGFTYEGTFRQATIYKRRNRDTAWFAMLDWEFSHLRAAYEAWLDPSNFAAGGHQHQALADLTAAALAKASPPTGT